MTHTNETNYYDDGVHSGTFTQVGNFFPNRVNPYTEGQYFLTPTTSSSYAAQFQPNVDIGINGPLVDNLLSGFLLNKIRDNNSTFTDYLDFQTAWENWWKNRTYEGFDEGSGELFTANRYVPIGSLNTNLKYFYDIFKDGYLDSVHSSIIPNPGAPSQLIFDGDFSFIDTNVGQIERISAATTENATNLNIVSNPLNPFESAFTHFLKTFDYASFRALFPLSPSGPISAATTSSGLAVDTQDKKAIIEFSTRWIRFLNGTATILSSFSDGALNSYEATYYAFTAFPPGSEPTQSSDPRRDMFISRFTEFYDKEITDNKYFNPTQAFNRWVDKIREESGFVAAPSGPIVTSLDSNNSKNIQVINRILNLLIKMIKTLQDVGIAQASKLRFTTSYQAAYTALQQQIPVFIKRNAGNPLETTGDTQLRNDINATFNTLKTDRIRALRELQEDTAKKQQSDLNQTNDAVNQQTDMATTFIQQMSTLVSTILR